MNIKLNGKAAKVAARISVGRLLDDIKISRDAAAVELNGRIIKKENFDSTPIPSGAIVEIIRFMGGG
ncbi:MAG: sulfur carrier protein ThiS [Endomicrobiia bacterium]|nr:sulfur carrier protein ThiS [Endomicrobiia bacterium]